MIKVICRIWWNILIFVYKSLPFRLGICRIRLGLLLISSSLHHVRYFISSLDSVDLNLPNRRRRLFRRRIDPFQKYNDVDFKMQFRFEKNTVLHILEMIGYNLIPATQRNHSIDTRTQLLIALHYYATGSFQMTIGDTFNVNKSTVCRVVRITRAIAQLKPQFISMPHNGEEMHRVATTFF